MLFRSFLSSTRSSITLMQSTPPSDTSPLESEESISPDTAPEGFTITLMDVTILTGYISDFQKGDTETRKKILERVMGELYALRPQSSSFDKNLAKKVFAPA